MSGYRFLSPAEEEMTEAALFYDAASSRLGSDFLDDVQQAIDRLCEYPESGEAVVSNLRRMLLQPLSIQHRLFSRNRHNFSDRDRPSWQATGVLAVSH